MTSSSRIICFGSGRPEPPIVPSGNRYCGDIRVVSDTLSRRILPVEAIDAEILGQLKLVAEGHLTIAEFEEWHVGRTWGESSELIAEIDFILVEKSLFTEEQLRSELLAFLPNREPRPAPTG